MNPSIYTFLIKKLRHDYLWACDFNLKQLACCRKQMYTFCGPEEVPSPHTGPPKTNPFFLFLINAPSSTSVLNCWFSNTTISHKDFGSTGKVYNIKFMKLRWPTVKATMKKPLTLASYYIKICKIRESNIN